MIERIPTFCGKDCGGGACPLVAVVEDGELTRMERNPAGGDIKACPRGYRLHLEHGSPERLLRPLVADGPRGSGRYREAGWDEALDIVASRLGDARSRRGPNAVMALGSAGSVGALHNSENLLARFLGAAGGATMLSSNYSNGAARFALPYLLGAAAGESGWDARTVRDSRLVVLWGANVLEARLGAELGAEIAAAARAGTPIIVIDPRRSRTAKALGARWIPIRPGTDAAMMLAVLYTLFRDGRVDRGRGARLAVGLDDIERYVSGAADGVERSPSWAESRCGVPATAIEDFAREYASARPAMLVPGYSIQRVRDGEEAFRLTVALQIATGNFGARGGSTGSLNNRLPPPRAGSLPPIASGSPSVPILRWPDAILEGRAGGYPSDVVAACVAGFNAVNQGADSRKSMRAMRSLEFSVCHEMFMTPTARLCDVVLPVASALEKEDLCSPWLGNYLLYKRAAAAPRGSCRTDYDIFADLAGRMGCGAAFTGGRTAREWIDAFIADSAVTDVGAFRESGVYLGADRDRVGLEAFAAAPEDNPLPTPSGRVELRSEAYARDTGRPAIPTWADAPADPELPFLLITPKTIHRTHSQGGDYPGAPDTGELTMSAIDAARLGARDGDELIVSNGSGSIRARAAVSGDIAPGVVCLHEGAWLRGGQDGSDSGGCANILTSTDGTGPAVAPVMHGVPVRLSRI